MSATPEPGSYRDPDGGVFYESGAVRRRLRDAGGFYRGLLERDVVRGLLDSGRLVGTRLHAAGDEAVFEHERVPFVTYPCEWSPRMLRAAGRLTLELQEELLGAGLSLKDATPYNVQFRGGAPVFIDFGSIEPASEDGVWIAYNQFAQNFLYPLMAWDAGRRDLPGLFLSRLDGLPFAELRRAAGLAPAWRYGAILDYLLPAVLAGGKPPARERPKTAASLAVQKATARRLARLLGRLRLEHGRSAWSDYVATQSYSEGELESKKKFVAGALTGAGARRVLDLGANTGDYAFLAAATGAAVVAAEPDEACLDAMWEKARARGADVLPLRLNAANPTPAFGWRNRERRSFLERAAGQFDAVLALALVHHLLVTERVPLPEIAALLGALGPRTLVVEYVGPEDRMFRELTRLRRESYAHVTREAFEAAFSGWKGGERLDLRDPGRGMDRTLYRFTKA